MSATSNGRKVALGIGEDALPLLMTRLLDLAYAAEDHKPIVETISAIQRLRDKDEVGGGARVAITVQIGDGGVPRIETQVTEAIEVPQIQPDVIEMDDQPVLAERTLVNAVDMSMFDLGGT